MLSEFFKEKTRFDNVALPMSLLMIVIYSNLVYS